VLRALRALVGWLERERIPHVVIGGIAVGALGRPRATRDVDAIVLLADRSWESFEKDARRSGFPPRIEEAVAFARGSRVFLLRHTATGVDVDVSVGALPFEEEAILRARRVAFAGGEIPFATPEDLIIMKIVASRPQDLADIDVLARANPDVDLDRVRRYTRAFAEVLEVPELVDVLERLLSRSRRK
jgi:nucleotidyltransferase DUF2204